MNLIIKNNSIPIDRYPIEIVERKGLGHPDTIADGIAEMISIEYSKYCLEKFGVILHHNVDKIAVLGGLCELEYGRGVLLKPYRVILNGRMSRCFGEEQIAVEIIQATAAKNYLHKILPRLDTAKDLEILTFTSSNSRIPRWFTPRTIKDLPEHENPRANDTATTVGLWPLSTTERIVLESERFFYSSELNQRFDFTGPDIKVMALRRKQNLELTLCVPFQADKIKNKEAYFDYKFMIQDNLFEFLGNKFGDQLKISLQINTQDQKIMADNDNGKGRYLTVIGSALDYGEEGVVGRGNRYRGLISCMRYSAVESIYGKNPVYHVGKIYSLIANTLAREIGSFFGCEAIVVVTTRNGDPLYSPYSIFVELSKSTDKNTIEKIINNQLQKRDWTKQIVMDGIFLPENELRYEQ